MRPGSWVAAAKEAHCHSKRKPFSHRGRAVTQRDESGERIEGRKEAGGVLKPSILSFKCEAWLCRLGFSEGTVCFFRE